MQRMSRSGNHEQQKPTSLRSFRINPEGAERELVQDMLRAEGFEFEPEPFSPSAFRLLKEPFPLGRSLAAFFGLIYIQDRSSMLPALMLQPEPNEAVLDMCASPGSKTGFLSHLVGTGGLVLANEPNPTRLGTLRANLSQQNFIQTVTCKFQGQEIPLPPESFGKILLDPPCSGWGTVDKNPHVTTLWSGNKTKTLIALQRMLLTKAAQILISGGELVYSTCTTNPAENEEQVAWALENLPLEQLELCTPPGFGEAVSLRENSLNITPGLGEGQGFFVAKFLRKSSSLLELPETESKRPAYNPELISRTVLDTDLLNSSLLPPGELAEHRGNLMFLPERLIRSIPLDFPVQGAFVGKMARGSVLPLPRMRTLIVPSGTGPSLDLEELAPIRQLLSGQSLAVNFPGKNWLALYYKSLPLALLRIKNGRAIWTEH